MIAAAGDKAARRYLEFFAVTIENPNTRAAYFHACRRFFAWCEDKGLDELVAIEPMHVAAYIRALGKDFEKPTVKQHLAAIRMLFDWLVVGQVRRDQSRACGARTEARCQNAARPRCSRPTRRASCSTASMSTTVVGLRDRALIGMMAYSFRARGRCRRRCASRTTIPPANAGGCACTKKAASVMKCRATTTWRPISTPICRRPGSSRRRSLPSSARPRGRTGELTENPMSRVHVWQMIQRRAREAGLNGDVCCHTFRATGITAYLDNGGTLENAQLMAAHESPRTTKLYDRTGDEITLDEVERIVI